MTFVTQYKFDTIYTIEETNTNIPPLPPFQ